MCFWTTRFCIEELCNQKNDHDKELVLLQSDKLSYIHDDEIAQRLRNIKTTQNSNFHVPKREAYKRCDPSKAEVQYLSEVTCISRKI